MGKREYKKEMVSWIVGMKLKWHPDSVGIETCEQAYTKSEVLQDARNTYKSFDILGAKRGKLNG